MASKNKYWKGIDELQETQSFQASKSVEFPEQNNLESILADDELNESSTGRRDFLKFLGFSVAAATVAACEAPVIKAVPYVMKPENVVPGMPTWYASTYYDGSSYASILVKTREARPIFIKGNKDFGITNGSVTPQVIASVLGLYDSERLQGPTKSGKPSKWSTIDKDIKNAMKSAKKVVLVSNTVISPSALSSINDLKASIDGDFEHIQYDPISYAAIRRANELNYGKSMIASYDFSKAKTIVSVGADFLSTWLMPTEFASQYGETRNPDGAWMSKHFQFETVMSVTGSNADYRAMTKPSEEEAVLNYILSKLNGTSSALPKALKATAELAVKSLKNSGKESLVVCGTNNTGLQQLVNEINNKLGANGTTIDLYNELNLFQSEDAKMLDLVDTMSKGSAPDVVLFYNSNPVYSLPNGSVFAKGLKSVKTTISMNSHSDETSSLCTYGAPDHHALESWSDFHPKTKHYALAQPMITPIHNTASAIESFLVWSGATLRPGKSSTVAYDKIKEIFSEISGGDFDLAVHNSCIDVAMPTIDETLVFNNAPISKTPRFNKGLEVVAYQKTAIRSGDHANNPWLQELPDPITKVTWDNYITMNPARMVRVTQLHFDQENGLILRSLKWG